jgi:hypothetical protein
MKRYLMLIGIIIVLAAAPTWLAQAQTPAAPAADYEISWYTIDGVAARARGAYQLDGTIGQAEAGMLSGGSYSLGGGFWVGSATQYRCYLPIVMSNH